MRETRSQIAHFREVLARERARADRTEQEFSVLVLEASSGQGAQLDERLIEKLRKRTRLSDEIGWFDELRVGVLLPDTGMSGALKLANDIRHRTFPWPLNVTVYTYPGQWLPEDSSSVRPFSGGVAENSGVAPGPAGSLFDDGMPMWKRVFDIVGATVALVTLFPLFLIVGTLVAIVSPGPIFLRQNRVGYQGKCFRIWKFRTMKVGADTVLHQEHFKKLMAEDAPLTKLDAEGDPRIIPLGNLIRR
jgi:hypothetical protein